jgi:hypothetical protein
MAKVNLTRRGFGSGLLGAALPQAVLAQAAVQSNAPVAGPGPDESHLGNLYPFVQRQADSSPLALSFLRPEFSVPEEVAIARPRTGCSKR